MFSIAGAISGIVVGCLVFTTVVVIVVIAVRRRRGVIVVCTVYNSHLWDGIKMAVIGR